ncbi:MAG: SRPBCC domain-containing protein [Oligoflexia bacterium]|nr:SRPBCC domain-containing protein [Oligoflexia bacterium]
MPAIRRQILVTSAPRKVWAALTTSEGLTSWLVDEARVDGRKGGRVVLVSEDEDGNPTEDRGIIHKWRPTSHLEITFDTVGMGPLKGTRLAFQVALDGGETRIAMVHSGTLFDDPDQSARVEKDWRQAFGALQALLDG